MCTRHSHTPTLIDSLPRCLHTIRRETSAREDQGAGAQEQERGKGPSSHEERQDELRTDTEQRETHQAGKLEGDGRSGRLRCSGAKKKDACGCQTLKENGTEANLKANVSCSRAVSEVAALLGTRSPLRAAGRSKIERREGPRRSEDEGGVEGRGSKRKNSTMRMSRKALSSRCSSTRTWNEGRRREGTSTENSKRGELEGWRRSSRTGSSPSSRS